MSIPIMSKLKKYVSGLDTRQENIFNDNFSRFHFIIVKNRPW